MNEQKTVFAKNEMRTFPTKEEFSKDKKMRDKVYAYLQTNSYIYENEQKEKVRYCWKAEMTAPKILAAIGKAEGDDKLTLDMVKTSLQLFRAGELIKESKYQGKKIYILPDWQPGDYVYVKTDTLIYMVNECSQNAIKVYSFLKKKYQQHVDLKYTEPYRFSKNKMLEVIGYGINNQANYKRMDGILDSLINNKLIEIHQEWIMTGNDNKTQYYVLDKVNEDYQKLNKDAETADVTPVKAPEEPKVEYHSIEEFKKMTKEEQMRVIGF